MKSFDPREILQNEYDTRLSYSFWVSAAIAQGEHDLAFQFLKKNEDRKGTYIYIYILLYIKILYSIVYNYS